MRPAAADKWRLAKRARARGSACADIIIIDRFRHDFPLAGTVMPPAIAPKMENATDFFDFARDSQGRINLRKTNRSR